MKPKATILYLTRSTESDIVDLKRSLRRLDQNFNDQFGYPVTIFHEGLSIVTKSDLQRATRSQLTFAQVDFSLPNFINRTDVPEKILGRFSVGYRHMCRFFSGTIFNHPALAAYEWYWRLDTDSFLRGRIRYDVFKFMEAKDLWYGYIVMLKEDPEVVKGLWSATNEYIRGENIQVKGMGRITDHIGEWNQLYYYNNFEISKLSFGRSPEYQKFFFYLDQLRGIYMHRWGDAPIRTFAVSMFVPDDKIHQFSDISYSHAGYYTHWQYRFLDRFKLLIKRLTK